MKNKIKAVYPDNNQKINLANEQVARFAANYEIGASSEYCGKGDFYYMDGVTLRWESQDKPDFFEVLISDDISFERTKRFYTEDFQLTVADLLIATDYYWKVIAHFDGGNTEESDLLSFTTEDTPRIIKIDGVSNTRDIGGVRTEDGRRVNQGLVYRGANLDSVTDYGKTLALERYGIRTELDFRNMNEGTAGAGSPFGKEINYIHIPSPQYLGSSGHGIDNPANHQSIAKIIRFFAEESNYPIYMHCVLGRDRTGSIALLLQGILGIPLKAILRDFELSFFSAIGSFDNDRIGHLIGMVTDINDKYLVNFSLDGSLKSGCEEFFKHIGITQKEIDTIRKILLE